MKAFTDSAYEQFRKPESTLSFMDEIADELKLHATPAQIENLKAQLKNGESLNKDPNFFVKHCLAPASPRLANAICQMHWRIEQTKDSGTHFVIGDAPVAVRRRGRPTDPYFVGIERADLQAEMYFPLSYDKLLIASWEKPKKHRIKVGKFRVDELNKISIVTSSFSVFSPTSDTALISQVKSLQEYSVTPMPMKI